MAAGGVGIGMGGGEGGRVMGVAGGEATVTDGYSASGVGRGATEAADPPVTDEYSRIPVVTEAEDPPEAYNPDYREVERVIASRRHHVDAPPVFLVKWRSLPYAACTWEVRALHMRPARGWHALTAASP